MIYLYNTSADTYKDLYRQAYNNLTEYLGDEAEDTTVYKILFMINLTELFVQAKMRSAIRGRYAKGQQGEPLLETIAMTDDERDYFDSIIPSGSAEVFRKMSAWAKNNTDAYKPNITFGLLSSSGTVDSVDISVITDSSLTLTPSALVGHKFVITSGALIDEERLIIANTATTISLEYAFMSDVTGLEFKTFVATDKHILYDLTLEDNWDRNMLLGAETAIKEALTAYVLKEWYLANRYLDDAQIEATRYQSECAKIRSQLMQDKTPYRRSGELFA